MFRQRLLTAIILIPIVLWLVFAASFYLFAVVLALLLLAAAWEWGQFIPLSSNITKGFYVCLLMIIILWSYANLHNKQFLLIPLALLLLLCLAGAIITYPRTRSLWSLPPVLILSGQILLGACWWSLVQLKLSNMGAVYLCYLLILVWAADTGAYLAGKKWGSRKFIPQVSPGKTYEGIAGGLVLSTIIIIVAGFLIKIPLVVWPCWLLLGFATVITSIFGDLMISMFKRNVQLKDTGAILPGHGGILDRIDSLLAAGVFFTYFAIGLGLM